MPHIERILEFMRQLYRDSNSERKCHSSATVGHVGRVTTPLSSSVLSSLPKDSAQAVSAMGFW